MPNGFVHPNARDGARQDRSHDHASRHGWQQLIAENAENGYLVTLWFYRYLDPDRAIQTASHFLLRMNRRLFGKRFKACGKSLKGMVVLEKKRHSTRSSNGAHFHFVVKADERMDTRALREAAEWAAGRLCYPTIERDRPFGPVITGPDLVDVRKIYDPPGLADYLTKECHKFGPTKEALNIGFVTPDGIEGLSAMGVDMRRDHGASRVSQATAGELDFARYTTRPVEGTKYAEMTATVLTGPAG